MAIASDISSAHSGRIRNFLAATIGFIGNVVLFAGIALLGGLATSWYMIEVGSPLTTVKVGPWVSWPAIGTPNADPYTRAHMARQGSMPISGTLARVWEARTDDTGQRLHSSCDYAVVGRGLNDGFWTIAVFDDSGQLIPNAAGRYAFNSSSIMRAPDGSFHVSLSRDARPGNWLPTSGAGRFKVVLTLLEAGDGLGPDGTGLPEIRRVACR
ncbi:MAG: hypothetical protein DIU63_12230 [Proteobacteria bacterium]|nr:MAG: hypothetical protein DIU63_12230 [Pseudomonadota bacterium]